MPKETGHFVVVNMPDFPEQLAKKGLQLSAISEELLHKGHDAQGYAGLLDLGQLELTLTPAYNEGDGLLVEDKNGGKFQGKDGKEWYVKSASRLGEPAGDIHSKAILKNGKKLFTGEILGFGVWKAGTGIKFVSKLPSEAGQVRDEFYITKQNGQWQLYYIEQNDSTPRLVDFPTSHYQMFDELAKKLPDKKPEEMSKEDRKEIENFLANYSRYYEEKIKVWKNRSTSLNAFAIQYSKLYQAWFIHNTQKHTTHLISLQREIPYFIFKKIVDTISKALQPEVLEIDLSKNPSIPTGPSGIRLHFQLEERWIQNPKHEVIQLIDKLSASKDELDQALLKELLEEREDLKKDNIFICNKLPSDSELKKERYQCAYFLVSGEDVTVKPKIFYIENGEKVEVNLSQEAATNLKKVFAEDEMAPTSTLIPRQYNLSEPTLRTIWSAIATDKKHKHFNEPEALIYYLKQLPDDEMLKKDCFRNAYVFTEEPTALFYVRNGKKEQLEMDERQVRSIMQSGSVLAQDKDENEPLPLRKTKLNNPEKIMEDLWSEICKNNGHIYPNKLLSPIKQLFFAMKNEKAESRDELEKLWKIYAPKIQIQNDHQFDCVNKAAQLKPFNNELVQFFLDKLNCNINVKDVEGRTLLMAAAEKNDLAALSHLLSMGADPETRDDHGNNLLYYAVRSSSTEFAKQLLLLGNQDINAQGSNGRTPLMVAIEKHLLNSTRKNPEIIDILLQKDVDLRLKDDYGNTILHHLNDFELAKKIIDKMKENNIDVEKVINTQNNDGSTVLHQTRYARPQLVELLFEHGADPLVQNNENNTGLHIAIEGNFNLTTQMIEKIKPGDERINSLHVDFNDRDGKTPLMLAVEKNQMGIVQLLLDKGANPLAANKRGETAIHFLLKKGQFNEATLLINSIKPEHLSPTIMDNLLLTTDFIERLKYGDPIINAPNSQGQTPLMLAIESQDTDLVRVLLQNGADPFLLDDDQNTAYDYMHAHWYPEVAAIMCENLLLYGNEEEQKQADWYLNPDCTEHLKKTIMDNISFAAYFMEELNNGYPLINMQNLYGQTILMQAVSLHNEKAVSLLLQSGANPFIEDNSKNTAYDYLHAAWNHNIAEKLYGHLQIYTSNDEDRQTAWYQNFEKMLCVFLKNNFELLDAGNSPEPQLAIMIDFIMFINMKAVNITSEEDRANIVKEWVNDYQLRYEKNPLIELDHIPTQFNNESKPNHFVLFHSADATARPTNYIQFFNVFLTGESASVKQIDDLCHSETSSTPRLND